MFKKKLKINKKQAIHKNNQIAYKHKEMLKLTID